MQKRGQKEYGMFLAQVVGLLVISCQAVVSAEQAHLEGGKVSERSNMYVGFLQILQQRQESWLSARCCGTRLHLVY